MQARTLAATLTLAALLGCETKSDTAAKSEPASSKPSPKASASASAAVKPASTPAAASSPAPTEAPAPAASASGDANADKPTCGGPKEVPEIPATTSNPPSTDEWKTACEVNTQGKGSEAKDCTIMVLREWLKVTCTGAVEKIQDMTDFGALGNDYYETVTPGSIASFVVRLKKGKNPKVRICREKDRASLFVSWPPSEPKPKIIALGAGQACE
jgi:hypothetical protein